MARNAIVVRMSCAVAIVGGDAEAPLEPDREVDQRDEERDQNRRDRLGLELGADARTDRLGAARTRAGLPGTRCLRTPTMCAPTLSAFAAAADALDRRHLDEEVVRRRRTS